ncbi:hypothetical protein FPV67DRAFT_1466918 [Lyophyllum atratum]|nr:hypothetical protein FPV67DRAFT_1466918 [Lyophyllum atratum]
MDAPSTSSNPGTQVRQKRVLPSRSRRGGPGVGNCDADVMILETQRRKFENEPLIPADTPFLLTTNSAVASTSATAFAINIHANDRYFERPEVLKAYREQSTIQTPEFVSLGDTPAGRLRARSQAGITEDGPPETSDAAYEKRHRKYETFEKRQRLREKEKLKHEQYKLKERIDQLRGMDPSAFLTLPDNLFPVPPDEAELEVDDTEGNTIGVHVNGGPAHKEGERRRREMLDIAYTLEERYRVLLPPDRVRKLLGQVSVDASVEPEVPVYAGREKLVEAEEEPLIETARQESERLKLKIKFPSRPPNATIQASASKSASYKKRRQSAPPPPKQPPIRRTKVTREESLIQPDSPIIVVDFPPTPSQEGSPLHLYPGQQLVSRSITPMSNPEIAVLKPGSPETELVHDQEQHISELSSRPRKRARRFSIPPSSSFRYANRESSVPPIESISALYGRRSPSHASTVQSSRHHTSYAGSSGRAERMTSLLMKAAIRSAGTSGRKVVRHLTAFGGKLRNETFEGERDFELGEWIDLPSDTEESHNPDYYASEQRTPGMSTSLTPAEFSRRSTRSPTPDVGGDVDVDVVAL